jgi:hypothetical protein
MNFYEQLGILVSSIMIVSQLSLVFGDNLFFRWSTKVVIGYALIHALIWGIYWTNYYAVAPVISKGQYEYIIPLILSLLMYSRLSYKYAWLSKYPMGAQLAVGFGVVSVGQLRGQILDQIRMTVVDLFAAKDWYQLLNSSLVLIGTLTVISYFFFTREHTGILSKSSYVGRIFIMSSIATIWAGDYLWAMAMLAGQLQYLVQQFLYRLILGRP